MRMIGSCIRLTLVLMLVCGLLYNLAVTGVAQAVMPRQADGSLLYNDQGELIGSEWIGQNWTDPKYFHGRVSSIDYAADGSGTPNYAPSNPDMLQRTKDSIADWQTNNPDVPVSELPIDLVTNSGSGLDPHISPESAAAQIPRISRETGIPADRLSELVERHTDGRELGIFGEPRVKVLKLNIDLNQMLK